MTFLEMLSSIDEDSRNFDIMSRKIDIFIESSYGKKAVASEPFGNNIYNRFDPFLGSGREYSLGLIHKQIDMLFISQYRIAVFDLGRFVKLEVTL